MINSRNQAFLIKYGPDHIRDTHIANSRYGDERHALFTSPLLSEKQQHALADKGTQNLRKLVQDGENIHPTIIDRFVSTPHDHWNSQPDMLLYNAHLPPHALHVAINHPEFHHSNIYDLLAHPKSTSEHLDQVIDKHKHQAIERFARLADDDPDQFKAKVTDGHVKKLIDSAREDRYDEYNESSSFIRKIVRKKYDPDGKQPGHNVPSDVMDHLLRHPSKEITRIGTSHYESLTPEHIDHVIDHTSPMTIKNATYSDKFNGGHLQKLVERTNKEPDDTTRWKLTGLIRDHLESKGMDEHQVRRKLKELNVKDD